jgi:hypothetical protein
MYTFLREKRKQKFKININIIFSKKNTPHQHNKNFSASRPTGENF